MPSADSLFALANPLPMPGWLLLVFLPRWRFTLPTVRLLLVPILALAYAGILGSQAGGDGNFNSLAGVQQLFANPYALVAGWIHYLAFDLFVGSWIVEDALHRQVSAWARIVPLPLTLMFGPVGLLLYLILRQITATDRSHPAITGGVHSAGVTA